MLRRLGFAALFALAACAVQAQDARPPLALIAPTPPIPDNTDRIANTAWVNLFFNNLPLTQGKIYIGNASNIATQVTPSGDCTISISGVITCTQSAGNYSVTGNLAVGGTTVLSGAVTMNGGATINGTLTVNGAIVDTSGNISTSGNATVNGNATIGGNLTVGGTFNARFAGTIAGIKQPYFQIAPELVGAGVVSFTPLGGLAITPCPFPNKVIISQLKGAPACSQTSWADNYPALSLLFAGSANNIQAMTSYGSFATKGSPANNDIALIYSVTDAGFRAATLSSWPSNAGVSSIAGNTGAFTLSGLLSNSVNVLQVVAAVKADQTAASSATLAVTPLHQQEHDSAVKVWINFTGATCANNGSYNVASCTRNSTGNYTIAFTTSFANVNYACSGLATSAASVGTGAIIRQTAWATGSAIFDILDTAGANTDPTTVGIFCVGRQ